MDLRDLVRSIPANGLKGSDIFEAYRRKEITFEEWIQHEAIRAAELAHEHHPVPYPPMPGVAREYVKGRLAGTMPYDVETARILGLWFFQLTKAREYNAERIVHFEWARERCASVGLTDHAQKAAEAVERFSNTAFPTEDHARTLWVKERDAIAREKG